MLTLPGETQLDAHSLQMGMHHRFKYDPIKVNHGEINSFTSHLLLEAGGQVMYRSIGDPKHTHHCKVPTYSG